MKMEPRQLRLYAVTDRAWARDTEGLLRQVAEAIDGGAGIVQLREKHLEPGGLPGGGGAVRGPVPGKGRRQHHQRQCGDRRPGRGPTASTWARRTWRRAGPGQLLGPDKLIGVSAHSVAEALAAQAAGADYLGVGAAFVTGTKTDAKPITRETIRAITAAVDIPVVAIGGISRDNILELRDCGLDGVAVVSALFAQADVKAAAAELLRLSEEIAR